MILMSGRITPLRFTATPLLRVTTPARAVALRLRRMTTPLPWPESATDKQRAAVEAKAQAVLAARAEFMDWGAPAPARAVSSALAGNTERARTSRASGSATRASLTAPEAGALPEKACTLADLYDPLDGIADFQPQVNAADTNNDLAGNLYKQAEKATETRDKAFGPNATTPGYVRFFVTSARDVLAGLNKGSEHKLGDWGFEVDASPQPTPAAKAAAKAAKAAKPAN
jgi:hypothetical protein